MPSLVMFLFCVNNGAELPILRDSFQLLRNIIIYFLIYQAMDESDQTFIHMQKFVWLLDLNPEIKETHGWLDSPCW